MPRIIGFAGAAGAGKNYAAEEARQQLTYGNHPGTSPTPRVMAFADPLKRACAAVFDWHLDEVRGTNKQVDREAKDVWWSDRLGRDISIRSALQEIGTDLFRKHWHDDIWIAAWERRVLRLQQGISHIFVTDVRFVNEVEAIRKHGGTTLYIQRRYGGKDIGEAAKHSSETSLKPEDCDGLLVNEGTPHEFARTITAMLAGQ